MPRTTYLETSLDGDTVTTRVSHVDPSTGERRDASVTSGSHERLRLAIADLGSEIVLAERARSNAR